MVLICPCLLAPVSYTHLDVYKRQVAIIVVIIWVAVWISTLFCSPDVIIGCVRVLRIPVNWLVPLVVIMVISVVRLVIRIIIGLIPMEWLVTWVIVRISVHIVPVIVLGISIG